jgi:hypothetical protein
MGEEGFFSAARQTFTVAVAFIILISGLSVLAGKVSAASPPPSTVTDVYFNYMPWYNTRDYACWDGTGKSTKWQGTAYNGGYDTVHNAGVVRQGTTVCVTGVGASEFTFVTIWGPKDSSGSRATVTTWHPRHSSGGQWEITVPGDADVGDYKVYMDGTYATLYVVFNIMKWKQDLNSTEWATWGYSENTTADEYSWMAHPPGVLTDGHPYSERLVEFVCSIMGPGITREYEAVAGLGIIAQKRILYGGTLGQSEQDFDTMNLLDGTTTYTYSPVQVTDARLVIEDPTRDFPSTLIVDAYCSHYAVLSFGMMKAIGVVTRVIYDASGTWGWGYHNWVECYLPDVSQSVNGTFNGWLTVDNTRQLHDYGGSDRQDNGSPALDTQQDYTFMTYAFTANEQPGTHSGSLLTFRYLGSGTETDSVNWARDDVFSQYDQNTLAKAEKNLPTLVNHDVFRGYLDEGDRDYFRVKVTGVSSITLSLQNGSGTAQLYARKDASVVMNPLDSPTKNGYQYDWWGDDGVTNAVPVGVNYVYVMVDNARGAQYSDDYVDGEIRYYEVGVSLTGSPPPAPPACPLALRALGVNSSVFLSWGVPVTTGGAVLTGYKIFRGNASGGEGPAPVVTVAPGVTSYTDYPPTSGTYYYIVTAVNSAGDSPPSNEASANVTVVMVVPEFGGFGSIALMVSMVVIAAPIVSCIRKRNRRTTS